MDVTSFRFAAPWLFVLLLVLPWLFWVQARRARAALRYSDVRVAMGSAAARSRSWRVALRPLLPLLQALTAVALIVALARPQFVHAREVVRGEGVDIALALDISGSMASLDFEPDNRLQAAKQVIGDFISERPHDRMGLVVFARNAYNQSPPTIDHRVLRRLLDETRLAPEFGLEDGTAIGMGLANAASMLKDSDAASRVLILVTDGVNNAGQIDPLTAAQAAQALGIKVYTIGMGRPGPVPVPITDLFGRTQMAMQESALDEGMLLNIAEATGGRYYRADSTDMLRDVYAEIDALERSEFEVEIFTQTRELAGWAMAPALLFLLLDLLLRHTFLRTLP